ncbi:hypothetical protein BH09ACT4_BH09ACT4_09930 [soil metagenome]
MSSAAPSRAVSPSRASAPFRAAGVSLVIAGLALAAARILEVVSHGQVDADDPAASLDYLAAKSGEFVAVGLFLLLAAGAVVVGATALAEILRVAGLSTLWVSAASAVALIGAGALVVAGVLHTSGPGPLAYIRGLDPHWGEAAYLAVQQVGFQAIYGAGVLGVAAWQIASTVLLWRRRVVPRVLAIFVLPAVVFFVTLIGALVDLPEGFFAVHIFGLLVGIPLWCVVVGSALLFRMLQQPAH